MEEYRCRPQELPWRFYRVQYTGCQTTHTKEDLEAADTSAWYAEDERGLASFKRAVENHFTWGYRGDSPFISLFSDRSHAENWGNAHPWSGSRLYNTGEWTLYTIDASLLERNYIFKISHLVDTLGVKIPLRAEQHKRGSYICLHMVPDHAILEMIGSDVMHSRKYHYDTFLGYDSDDWAIQNSINDDLIKMMEGLWEWD